MTPAQIQLYVDEIERRFRNRTPAKTVADALPDDRVNRSEMIAFAESEGIIAKGGATSGLLIRDDDLDRAIFKLFDRLRKEFPDEKWMPRSHWTAATKQRRKELGLR